MKGQGGRKLRWGREGRIEEMEGEETKTDQGNPTKVMGKRGREWWRRHREETTMGRGGDGWRCVSAVCVCVCARASTLRRLPGRHNTHHDTPRRADGPAYRCTDADVFSCIDIFMLIYSATSI